MNSFNSKIKIPTVNQFINFFFICGILFHAIAPEYMKVLTEFFLFATVLAVLFFSFYNCLDSQNYNEINSKNNYNARLNQPGSQKLVLFFVITSIITVIIEILGVKTGMIFGAYEYGKTFAIKILEVPIIIGLNWSLVILGSSLISQKWTDWIFQTILTKKQKADISYLYKGDPEVKIVHNNSKLNNSKTDLHFLATLKTPLSVLLTGFLAVFLDYFLEPVAIKMDYWNWQNGIIPIQNYIAWLVIAIVFDCLIRALKINQKTIQSKYFINLFWIELLFFICLNLVL